MYSHSTEHICTQRIILHPATVYLCSFKELYLFNFKKMRYLLTVKEINSYKEQGTLFTKSIYHSRQLYSFMKLYSFQGAYLFIQGNISSFKENIFIQGNYIHSRKYIYLGKVQGHMFIQGNYIH